MQKDIQSVIENHIKIVMPQILAYMPFIKMAFPYSKNLSESCYSLIVGNALSVFLNQYAMRLKYPTEEDFEEFGKIVANYRDNLEVFFK